MNAYNRIDSDRAAYWWPFVLCLIGVDYFSTLAYLPSIAVQAAGPLAPVAAGLVVLVTFLLALPVYWYVVGRAPDGRGATGLLETLVPGWRGKIVVLTMLGFAAADFVITRSLSLAVAAVHVIHNPHGQQAIRRLPDDLLLDGRTWWPPLETALRLAVEPQMFITLTLSVFSFGLWWVLRHGFTRRVVAVTFAAVGCYLLLSAVVIGEGLHELTANPLALREWWQSLFVASDDSTGGDSATWYWSWLSIGLWSFPQMALGLSGFEMIMTMAPRVRGLRRGRGRDGRIQGTRKLMLAAALLMAVYLLSAVLVTTLLVPHRELLPGGAADHRALAFLAHESAVGKTIVDPWFAHPGVFGDLFDLATVLMLGLAGVSVTIGLQNLLPHYLSRLGMELSWAGRVGLILNVLNMVVLLVTVVFRASPASQQWAYATSVLVLLAGAALAAAIDVGRSSAGALVRWPVVAVACTSAGFLLTMTGLTVLINGSGLIIALAFLVAILLSSIISRWIRSTELRFHGFEFVDEPTHVEWQRLRQSGAKVLVPHRPGLLTLAGRICELQRDGLLPNSSLQDQPPVIFIEALVGDPSNFYQRPLMSIACEEGHTVIRVSRCVSISHVLAAICLELCSGGGVPPRIIFGWSHERPLAANLNFLLLGEGNIPWMVKELVRRAVADPAREPRVVIG